MPLPANRDWKTILSGGQQSLKRQGIVPGIFASSTGRPNITDRPDLQEQLGLYDEAAGDYYDRSRAAYKTRTQMSLAGQRGRAMAGLEQSYARGTGGEFGGGERMQAEVSLQRAANEQEMMILADFDQQINAQIAQGRINVAIGHFDYTRSLALMEREGQLNWDMMQYGWEMQKDIATQQAWFGFAGDIAGAFGMWAGGGFKMPGG